MGCPIMTPLPNTTDKTHGEWKRERKDGIKIGWGAVGDKQQRREGRRDSPAVPTAATERPAAAER